MPEPTPKPWLGQPTTPTPEEVVDWFEVATREERLEAMTRLLRYADIAGACILEGHVLYAQELAAQLRRATENRHV